MKKNIRASLTEGPITPLLIKLTMPMVLGMLSMTIFNLTDTYFIGRLGKEQLAAMSFTFPVVMILNSIALGLGIGASSILSRTIGGGKTGEVRRFATDALLLAVFFVAFFVAAGEVTIGPLFRLLGAPDNLLPMITVYMRIWYIGIIFVVVPMTGNSIIRATGDTKTPGIIMTIAASLNIILDPLLIFGLGPFPRMGIAGGALATVIARSISLVLSLSVLIFREKLLTLEKTPIRTLLTSWKKILFIGVPASLTNLITPLAMGFITRLIAGFGIAAVAGFGVASRIEMLVLMVVRALSSILVPFTGQNWGAGKKERIKTAIKSSIFLISIWSLFLYLILFLFGHPIAAIFNKDPDIIKTVVLYVRIVAISYIFQGILLISSSALNALNKPLHAISLSIFRVFVLYIPLSHLGGKFLGLPGIFISVLTANLLSGLLGLSTIERKLSD